MFSKECANMDGVIFAQANVVMQCRVTIMVLILLAVCGILGWIKLPKNMSDACLASFNLCHLLGEEFFRCSLISPFGCPVFKFTLKDIFQLIYSDAELCRVKATNCFCGERVCSTMSFDGFNIISKAVSLVALQREHLQYSFI